MTRSPVIDRRTLLGYAAAGAVLALGNRALAEEGAPAGSGADSTAEPAPEAPARELRPVLVALRGNVYARMGKGKPYGIMAEVVQELLPRISRLPSFISLSASGEILSRIKDGGLGAAVPFHRSKKIAAPEFRFSEISDEYNLVAVRRGETFPFGHSDDLKGKIIGGRENYVYPLIEKNPELNLVRYQSDGAMLRELILRRIDAAILSGQSDIYTFRTEGIMSRIELLEQAIGVVNLGVLFSSIHFDERDVAAFDSELAKLKKSHRWVQILDRNGFLDLMTAWPVIPG